MGLSAIALLAFGTTTAMAQEARIAARPLSHEDIAEYNLPEDTQPSGGLFNVGVGQPAYLEVQVVKGTPISSLEWTLASKPSGSSAALMPSPLGEEVPMFEPADIRDYDLAGRQLLLPDMVGTYVVTAVATVTPDGSEILLTNTVTAGNYVGVGSLGGTPTFPQCVICHSGPLDPTGYRDALVQDRSRHHVYRSH